MQEDGSYQQRPVTLLATYFKEIAIDHVNVWNLTNSDLGAFSLEETENGGLRVSTS